MTVSGEEYNICDKASKGDNFWGNSKPGAYGAGLGRTLNDPYKPARTGMLGQMAYGKLLNEPVDILYRQGGDEYDTKLGNLKVDIKCAMRNYGCGLVYHQNEWGKTVPLNKDLFIFSHIANEDRQNQSCDVVFMGAATSTHIKKCPIRRGRKGRGHKNYEVSYQTLLPMQRFISLSSKLRKI